MGGCMGNTSNRQPKQQGRIIILVQKIRILCEHELTKRQKSFTQQQMILLQNFHKQKSSRSQTVQKAMINRIVFYKNIGQSTISIYIVYFICSNQCKLILDRKGSIDTNLDMVKNSLQTLVYSASILKEEPLYQLQEIMRKYPNFKFPNDQDIRHQLIRYQKKTQEVTFQMENSYILNFCGKCNLEMSKVCEIGHQYGYNSGRLSFAQ